MASHKYVERKWVNGQWVYKYRTDEKNSDQLRRMADQEMEYRNRMVRQTDQAVRNSMNDHNNLKRKGMANHTAVVRRNDRGFQLGPIQNPEDHQEFLKTVYKNQSLGTKIKADARSAADDVKTKTKAFKDTVSKAISDKKAHNLMLKQNKKAAKNAAEAQKNAPKIAEKIAKSNKKMSEISPKTTKTGEDFLTKILVSDYQRMLLGDKKPKK